MENELIIDGQVLFAPENQETQSQNTVEQPRQASENNAAQVPLLDTDNIAEKSDLEVEPAPKWVKELRKGFKETQKENRDLKRQLEKLTTPPPHQSPVNHDNVIPAKPMLGSCDYDEEVYGKAMTDWHEKKSHVEQKQQAQQRQQREVQERFIERLKSHQQRAAKSLSQ